MRSDSGGKKRMSKSLVGQCRDVLAALLQNPLALAILAVLGSSVAIAGTSSIPLVSGSSGASSTRTAYSSPAPNKVVSNRETPPEQKKPRKKLLESVLSVPIFSTLAEASNAVPYKFASADNGSTAIVYKQDFLSLKNATVIEKLSPDKIIIHAKIVWGFARVEDEGVATSKSGAGIDQIDSACNGDIRNTVEKDLISRFGLSKNVPDRRWDASGEVDKTIFLMGGYSICGLNKDGCSVKATKAQAKKIFSKTPDYEVIYTATRISVKRNWSAPDGRWALQREEQCRLEFDIDPKG